MDKILFTFLLSGGIFCFGVFISFGIMKQYHSKRYGRISSSVFLEHHLERIYQIFSRSRAFIKINNEIAYKVSVFNTLSFEKNRRIGTAVVLLFLILMFILSVIITLIYLPFWYIALVYIIFINTAALFILQLLYEIIMNRYLKCMPEALKILQSRFLSKGSISKAIHTSIPDLPKGIKSEMIRIYDAIKQNEPEKTKDVFREIDKKYTNEHMSVLLDLIWLAHYNGGTETIKAQFDSMVRDVLEDLENQQDLRSATMSYIVMSLLFMAALPIVRVYNKSILSPDEMQYYATRGGLLFAAGYIGFLILLIAVLFYLKKKG